MLGVTLVGIAEIAAQIAFFKPDPDQDVAGWAADQAAATGAPSEVPRRSNRSAPAALVTAASVASSRSMDGAQPSLSDRPHPGRSYRSSVLPFDSASQKARSDGNAQDSSRCVSQPGA